MDNRIKNAVIDFVTEQLDIELKTLEFLPNGVTNFNYLLNNTTVIKAKDEKLNFFHSSSNEIETSQLLFKLDITPKHAFYDGFVVVDYLGGVKFLNYDNYLAYMDQLVTIIKTFHQLAPKNFSDFDMFSRLEAYRDTCKTETYLPNEKGVISTAKYYFNKAKKVPCHNDLVNGNILIKDNRLFLIDFEYSGLNDPDFDVVSFLSENDFVNDEVRQAFLSRYYGEDIPKAKLEAYTQFANLLWYYWALFAYKQTKRAIFKKIALHKRQQYLA